MERSRSLARVALASVSAALILLSAAVPALAVPPGAGSRRAAVDPEVVLPWTTDELVTVALSLLSDNGLFDKVRFAVDGEPFGAWLTVTPEALVQLPSIDGAHEIHIQLASSLMDAGEYGSVDDPLQLDVPTTLDTVGPITLAPQALQTVQGRTTRIAFSVKDSLSPQADVRLAVRDAAGRTVRTARLGRVRTGVRVAKRVTLALPRGRYTYSVLAADLAGNAQRRAGTNSLVVR